MAAIGENIDAAGDLDKLGNSPNSRDQRIVPVFEEYPRLLRQTFRSAPGFDQTGFESGDKLPGSPARIHDRAKHADHIEDPGNGSLIERMDIESTADQFGSDVGLQIRKGQDEVGLKCEDFVYIGRGEGAHSRILA